MPISDDPAAPLHPGAFSIVSAQGKSGHLSNQFADLLAEAGLREKKTHRKNEDGNIGRGRGSSAGGLSFHCLRHTAVTLMKEAGIPAAVVMELVGHDSEAMSRHYTHVGADALRKAAAALPDITLATNGRRLNPPSFLLSRTPVRNRRSFGFCIPGSLLIGALLTSCNRAP